MRVERKYKPHLAASKDETRLAIKVLNVVQEHKGITGPAIVATDGRMLAVVPCEIEDKDVLGQLRPDALRIAAAESVGTETKFRARRHRSVKASVVSLALSETRITTESTAEYPRYSKDGRTTKDLVGTYPNSSMVVPDISKEAKIVTSFNPTMLLELVQAIGGDGKHVKLEQDDAFSPIRVTVQREDKAFGVLMPMI